MARNEGWVKVYRSLLDNPLWGKEKFTEGQAWVDLILLANHEEGVGRKGDIIPPGSLVTSNAILAERWHWDTGKVRRFINKLADTNMIQKTGTKTGRNGGTFLTIVKYGFYQGQRPKKRQESAPENRQENAPTTRNKESKEEKNSRSRSGYKSQNEKLEAIRKRKQRVGQERKEE